MATIELVQEAPRSLVGIRRKVPVAELGAFFAEVLPRVHRWVREQRLTPASMPMAVWWDMDRETGVADCQAGCLLDGPVEGEGEITPALTPGGEVLTLVHRGPYSTVGASWMKVYARAAELGKTPGAGWEEYVDDPTEVPEDALRTVIHLPVR